MVRASAEGEDERGGEEDEGGGQDDRGVRAEDKEERRRDRGGAVGFCSLIAQALLELMWFKSFT